MKKNNLFVLFLVFSVAVGTGSLNTVKTPHSVG